MSLYVTSTQEICVPLAPPKERLQQVACPLGSDESRS
jgi:hypothetical protein